MTSPALPKWREPAQERSRKRVKVILEAASELIEKSGFERLKMREIADRANVPIGTVYQFFDDRDAILSCLVSQFLEWQDTEISTRFKDIDSIDRWIDAIEGSISAFYHRSFENPAISEIWRGAYASKAIRHLDFQASMRHSKQLFAMLRPLVPDHIDDQHLQTNCLLVCDLTGAAIRTALELPRPAGEHYISQFEELLRARLCAIVAS